MPEYFFVDPATGVAKTPDLDDGARFIHATIVFYAGADGRFVRGFRQIEGSDTPIKVGDVVYVDFKKPLWNILQLNNDEWQRYGGFVLDAWAEYGTGKNLADFFGRRRFLRGTFFSIWRRVGENQAVPAPDPDAWYNVPQLVFKRAEKKPARNRLPMNKYHSRPIPL